MQLDTRSKVESHNWSTWFQSCSPTWHTHTSGILKYLHLLPIEQCIKLKLATLTHNTLCSTHPAYLHSLLNYHTAHVLYALQMLTCCVFHVFALSLHPVVSVLQLPQSGTHSHLASSTRPLPILSIAFLKITATSRPSAPPSGSPKCLRFGLWLTLCTLNIHLLTYLYWKRVINLAWLITPTNMD